MLISLRTKEAMYRPEVNQKLHKGRKPRSLEARKRQSDLLAGLMPANLGYSGIPFSNVQRGEYDINGKVIYFRSKWEANYAIYLDFLIKQKQIKGWEFEPDVFVFEKIQFGTRSYRPDFKITNNDGSIEYHEVKGYMDARSNTKLKRMAKYFPKVKLILIDFSCYKDIAKKMGRALKFY